ncbi:Laccase-2 [Leucoagaricus sp. SymC.cos]|nr:Laccase-2 [Leucoagaricus sp. SymC.cos]
MKLIVTSLFLAILQCHSAYSVAVKRATKQVSLDIVNANLAPDGFMRSTVVANGQYPGPLITANKGDTLEVTINNNLTDPTMRRSTSLNFDGIFFNTQDAFLEGTPFVTTCPVAPTASFTYTVPLGNQTGTYWYHRKLPSDPDDPQKQLYDVDNQNTIWQVGDWWHNTTIPLLDGYVATGIVPVSDSGTFNGVGRFQGGPEVPFFVQDVDKGKRYRFRIINTSARNVFTMSIDSHNMTIIEADGQPVKPLTVNEIEILAGQRYSVVVETNQPVGNYWINAPFVGGDPTRNPNQNATLSRAILRYAGAPDADPETPMTQGPANPNALVEADLRTTGKAQWNVNGVSYLPPTTPTLLKIIDGANSSADFNETENTFLLPPNQVIQIIFPPRLDDVQNNFWLIKSNSSDADLSANPIRRDVAAVGAAGTIIRFETNNPGPWFFHCHIFWHMQAGLATVMLQDIANVGARTRPNQAWQELCPAVSFSIMIFQKQSALTLLCSTMLSRPTYNRSWTEVWAKFYITRVFEYLFF